MCASSPFRGIPSPNNVILRPVLGVFIVCIQHENALPEYFGFVLCFPHWYPKLDTAKVEHWSPDLEAVGNVNEYFIDVWLTVNAFRVNLYTLVKVMSREIECR